MTWLLILIPLFLVFVIITGVRVIQGKIASPSRERDEATVRKWAVAQKQGIWVHCVRSVGPYLVGYCILGPLVKASWQSGQLAYPVSEIPIYFAFTVLFSIIGGSYSWALLRSSANEAACRLDKVHP